MDDYVNRQAAILWVKTECNPYGKPTIDFESGKKVIEHLEQMPSVDAVEVVRCKDCKHNPKDTWFECPIADLPYNEDRWCWKGERKGE